MMKLSFLALFGFACATEFNIPTISWDQSAVDSAGNTINNWS